MSIESLSLNANRTLLRVLAQKPHRIELLGSDSPVAIAAILTEHFHSSGASKQQLVLCSSTRDIEHLRQEIEFFDPHVPLHILPDYDVNPYSGLYPSRRVASLRVGWCFKALSEVSGIYLATHEGLFSRTLPIKSLEARQSILKVDEELPSLFRQWLEENGYTSSPLVEEVGTFSLRGGIIDVFSPQYDEPIRIELFGDQIESMRFFSPSTQRSDTKISAAVLVPAREIFFTDDNRMRAAKRLKSQAEGRPVDPQEFQSVQQSVVQGRYFPGAEFLTGLLYEEFVTPLHFFKDTPPVWQINPLEFERKSDQFIAQMQQEFRDSSSHALRPPAEDLFKKVEDWTKYASPLIQISKIDIAGIDELAEDFKIRMGVSPVPLHFQSIEQSQDELHKRIKQWRSEGYTIYFAAPSESQVKRIESLLQRMELKPVILSEQDSAWSQWKREQELYPETIHILQRDLKESLRFVDDHLVFIREKDILGARKEKRAHSESHAAFNEAAAISFRDLKVGDNIVHVTHGIGVYEGLKILKIGGIDVEFLELRYKDNDKLFLPIYRINQIQKYSGGRTTVLDKMGGKQWEKTKTKVRARLREVAHELLKLYAERKEATRPPVQIDDQDYLKFADQFPYEETLDQLKAIASIQNDFKNVHPMDRLICGDVGFGKTEVAMRAAFISAMSGKQVAILAPTTVLTFQHFENFKTRFKNFPFVIKALNRFVSAADTKKTLEELKQGKVDILIGTHRILSKDISFKDLGLLVVDEEQKFGVLHKEKIRRLKSMVDTLAMSATPIPRTLNMSLAGLRDLSVINTAPVDRLPTRTFVTKFDKETIRKALLSEVERGGQAFFLHNRVQSIYSVADELRALVPEVRIAVGHGQMNEKELEETMVRFFKREIDLLVCTTIVESGIDIPNANTMFIDQAQTFGLSQLYQLRGRVGRGKQRAYCYLIIPDNRKLDADAQERLKVIQENTALGSGLIIAQHDLELRGAGTLLGEEQSGQIQDVGYEMFLELLNEALMEARGETIEERLDPEINLKMIALIPSEYIPDIRLRLSFYRRLTEIANPSDVDRLEEEMADQFGRVPEPVANLLGLMLIRSVCRTLGVKDLSAGPSNVSLMFSEHTKVNITKVIEIALKERAKYTLTPDHRLLIKLPQQDWPTIYDELIHLSELLLS